MTKFVLDTNVLHYKAKNSSYNVDEFWSDVVENTNHNSCIPIEVQRELEVQYYQLEYQGKEYITKKIKEELIANLDVLQIPESTEAEHIVRMASSYLSSKYEIYKPQTQLQIDHEKNLKNGINTLEFQMRVLSLQLCIMKGLQSHIT